MNVNTLITDSDAHSGLFTTFLRPMILTGLASAVLRHVHREVQSGWAMFM